MDPLTQGALGAAVAAVGFRERLGRKAVLFGAACGVLPDGDMLQSLWDPWAVMVHHRGWSHSLALLPALAPVFAYGGYRLLGGRRHFKTWLHLALWALLTHPLLDVCTSYGTQLLWPVSRNRLAIDAVSIIDPVYTMLLLAAVAAGLFKRRRWTRRLATALLVLSIIYLAVGFAQSRRAQRLARHELRQEAFQSAEVRAMPTLFNIFLWRVVARDATGDLRIGYVSTWSPRPIRFHRVDRPDDPAVRQALDSQRGRLFTWFAMGLVSAHVEVRTDGPCVRLQDQRYGLVTRPTESPFAVDFRFDDRGRPLQVLVANHGLQVDLRMELASMWAMIRNR